MSEYPCGGYNHYDTDNYKENIKRRKNNLVNITVNKDIPEVLLIKEPDGSISLNNNKISRELIEFRKIICQKCNCGDDENYPCQFGGNPVICNHVPSIVLFDQFTQITKQKIKIKKYKKIICEKSMCDSLMDDQICKECEFNTEEEQKCN